MSKKIDKVPLSSTQKDYFIVKKDGKTLILGLKDLSISMSELVIKLSKWIGLKVVFEVECNY